MVPDDERQLWRRVTETVTPLRPCRPSSPATARDAEAFDPDAEGGEQQPPRPGERLGQQSTRTALKPPTRVPDLDHGVAPGLDKRTLARLRKGQIRYEARLDLHGFTQVDANHRLAGFLASSRSAGRRCVLVITGKGSRGSGVLRQEVPRWLNEPANRGLVIGFCHAVPADGGDGALYVLLKRHRPDRPK